MSRFIPLLIALTLLLSPLAWAADDQGQQGGDGQQTSSGEQAGADKGKSKKKADGAAGDAEPECD